MQLFFCCLLPFLTLLSLSQSVCFLSHACPFTSLVSAWLPICLNIGRLTFVLPLPLLLVAARLWCGAGWRFALFGWARRLCVRYNLHLLLFSFLHWTQGWRWSAVHMSLSERMHGEGEKWKKGLSTVTFTLTNKLQNSTQKIIKRKVLRHCKSIHFKLKLMVVLAPSFNL